LFVNRTKLKNKFLYVVSLNGQCPLFAVYCIVWRTKHKLDSRILFSWFYRNERIPLSAECGKNRTAVDCLVRWKIRIRWRLDVPLPSCDGENCSSQFQNQWKRQDEEQEQLFIIWKQFVGLVTLVGVCGGWGAANCSWSRGVVPEFKTFRWWGRCLKFGPRFHTPSLCCKRVVQIIQCFSFHNGPNCSGAGTKNCSCLELEPEILSCGPPALSWRCSLEHFL